MKFDNEISITFASVSENESFARICVAGFVTALDPTIDELIDIKTAVSEAVTNAIIHGYENQNGDITLNLKRDGKTLYIECVDNGTGIADVNKAREALYTSKPEEERSGMGFTVMETFMDEVKVISLKNVGTRILMSKEISSKSTAVNTKIEEKIASTDAEVLA
ncbi:MAG: anti-sigma F factor [Lachnospirales bacterium]